MSWGTELWDQWENINLHTQKGISFLETYSHFVRDRCQVESEYARSLRRLVKTYLPKKKDDEDSQFTFVKAFREALYETGDLAGQHEVIAETLSTSVVQETHNLIKEIKEERKKHLNEGNKLQQQIQQSLQLLEKSKKNYEKAFKEAEKAEENFRKADLDLHLSRAEVEKQKMNASMKNRQCDDQKNEYANQLQKTNKLQLSHYTNLMPGIFQCLQDMDERRICHFANLLKKSTECQSNVSPIIEKCLDGIISAANSIEYETDSQLVVEKYKSGFTPPGDIQFDDLSTARINGESTTPVSHPPTRQDTIKGTISASKLRKRVGIFGIFGSNKDDLNDLPPNQRKKRIQLKIDEVNAKLSQEKNTRDGLLKMKEVYSSNPSLGDPASVMGSLNDSYQAIEKLIAELDRYQTMMEENDGGSDSRPPSSGGYGSGGPNTPTSAAIGRHANGGGGLGGPSPRSSVASVSDESLSRSASESSVNHNNTPPPPPPPPAPHLLPASYTTSPAHTRLSTPPNTTISSNHKTSSKQPPPPSRTSTTVLSKSFLNSNVSSSSSLNNSNATPTRLYSNANHRLNPTFGSSHSPESGIGLSRNSLHGTDSAYDQPDHLNAPHAEFDEYDESFLEQEPLPVIGTCNALYQFDATSEGSMAMEEGEKLYLVELDQGDGWTRVRRTEVFEEGFVPTTYIQITLDNNC